jgi:hypothetical protein
MVQRSTTSEFQPAPPCYRNQGKLSRTPGGPRTIPRIGGTRGSNVCVPPIRQMNDYPQQKSNVNAQGNMVATQDPSLRINTAGVEIGISENVEQKAISVAISPTGD